MYLNVREGANIAAGDSGTASFACRVLNGIGFGATNWTTAILQTTFVNVTAGGNTIANEIPLGAVKGLTNISRVNSDNNVGIYMDFGALRVNGVVEASITCTSAGTAVNMVAVVDQPGKGYKTYSKFQASSFSANQASAVLYCGYTTAPTNSVVTCQVGQQTSALTTAQGRTLASSIGSTDSDNALIYNGRPGKLSVTGPTMGATDVYVIMSQFG